MTPIKLPVREANTFGNWRNTTDPQAFIIEAWSQGFMFGALMIMAVITVANMRKGVLLHKMILLELLLAMSHGTFAFMSFPGYGWYLSATAALLYCANFTHNVVAWMKIAPFFTGPRPSFGPKLRKAVHWTYLSALLLTTPVVIFQIYNNFRFFSNISTLYKRVRPYEPLYRDPFWVFSCITLFYVISKFYNIKVLKMIRKSPRFGIMLGAILLSIVFSTMDILACIIPSLSETDGVNPYWKLALVFKCLTDNIILDDFKSVLQRLTGMELRNLNSAELNTYTEQNAGTIKVDYDVTVTTEAREQSISSTNSREQLQLHTINGSLDESGRGRQNESHTANTIGKLGVKISHLPRLPPTKSKNEGEASRNAESSSRLHESESWDPLRRVVTSSSPLGMDA